MSWVPPNLVSQTDDLSGMGLMPRLDRMWLRCLMLDLGEFIKCWQMTRAWHRLKGIAVLFNLSWCIWKVPFYFKKLSQKSGRFLKTLSIATLVIIKGSF